MSKTLPPAIILSALSVALVLSACAGGGGAPAGSGPIANPLTASCKPFVVKDTSVVTADGTVSTDAPSAKWPSSGNSALADELGLQDVINGSCYYDSKDNPYPVASAPHSEGGFFFRADPDEADVASYIEKMKGYLTDKGFTVTADDTGFNATADQVEVGVFFLDELTEEMIGTADNYYTELGLQPGDSMLFGSISRDTE